MNSSYHFFRARARGMKVRHDSQKASVAFIRHFSTTETPGKDVFKPDLRSFPSLAHMPTGALLRYLAFTTIMSTALLKPAMQFMKLVANQNARFFSPEKNPTVNMLLRPTVYRQFAAGENEREVIETINQMKTQGYTGVILGYAREIVIDTTSRMPQPIQNPTQEDVDQIRLWKENTLRTLRMLGAGDFLAVK